MCRFRRPARSDKDEPHAVHHPGVGGGGFWTIGSGGGVKSQGLSPRKGDGIGRHDSRIIENRPWDVWWHTFARLPRSGDAPRDKICVLQWTSKIELERYIYIPERTKPEWCQLKLAHTNNRRATCTRKITHNAHVGYARFSYNGKAGNAHTIVRTECTLTHEI